MHLTDTHTLFNFNLKNILVQNFIRIPSVKDQNTCTIYGWYKTWWTLPKIFDPDLFWIFKVKYKPEYTDLTCRQLANIILFYLFAAYYNQRGEGGEFFLFFVLVKRKIATSCIEWFMKCLICIMIWYLIIVHDQLTV